MTLPVAFTAFCHFWGGGRSTYQALKQLFFFFSLLCFSGSLFQEYSRDMENAYAVYCNGYTRSASLLQSYQETPPINEKIQEVLQILQWVPLLALYAAKYIAMVELKDVNVHCCFLNIQIFKASLLFGAPLPPRPSLPKPDYRSTPYNNIFFLYNASLLPVKCLLKSNPPQITFQRVTLVWTNPKSVDRVMFWLRC